MNPIEDKTTDELTRSLLAEVAKAKNEINCARDDFEKASRRLGFAILLINTIIERNAQD